MEAKVKELAALAQAKDEAMSQQLVEHQEVLNEATKKAEVEVSAARAVNLMTFRKLEVEIGLMR